MLVTWDINKTDWTSCCCPEESLAINDLPGARMIQFLPMAIGAAITLLSGNSTQSRDHWELTGTSTGDSAYELDAVERVCVFANSTQAAIKVERTVSRQWQRSVAWDVKAAIERSAKADFAVVETELRASLELHRGTATTEQYTSSQRIAVDIMPGSHVEILVHWYRQIQTGGFSLAKSADSSSLSQKQLTVPYREVTGLMAEVHVKDLQSP